MLTGWDCCASAAPRGVFSPASRCRRCRRSPASVLDRVRERRRPARRVLRRQPAVRVLQPRAASWSASTSRWRCSWPAISASSSRVGAGRSDGARAGLDPAVVRPDHVGRRRDRGPRRCTCNSPRPTSTRPSRSSCRDDRRRQFSEWASVRGDGAPAAGRAARALFHAEDSRGAGRRRDRPDRSHGRACSSRTIRRSTRSSSTAERGSAYTLLHPEYSVAVPKPRPFKVPLAYVDRRPRRRHDRAASTPGSS